MTAVETPTMLEGRFGELAGQLVDWLQTGVRPPGMFSADVFLDLSLPQWRLQALGAEAAFDVREDSHPFPGAVRVEGLDATARGFLIQFEERWMSEGQRWYCRELLHCVVSDGSIAELTVYCTGDWDEAVQARHQSRVHLLRT